MNPDKNFNLFVDSDKVIRYTFGNGTVITTEPDYEYRHRIAVSFKDITFCEKIEYRDEFAGSFTWLTVTDEFEMSSSGWMDNAKISFKGMLHTYCYEED